MCESARGPTAAMAQIQMQTPVECWRGAGGAVTVTKEKQFK